MKNLCIILFFLIFSCQKPLYRGFVHMHTPAEPYKLGDINKLAIRPNQVLALTEIKHTPSFAKSIKSAKPAILKTKSNVKPSILAKKRIRIDSTIKADSTEIDQTSMKKKQKHRGFGFFIFSGISLLFINQLPFLIPLSIILFLIGLIKLVSSHKRNIKPNYNDQIKTDSNQPNNSKTVLTYLRITLLSTILLLMSLLIGASMLSTIFLTISVLFSFFTLITAIADFKKDRSNNNVKLALTLSAAFSFIYLILASLILFFLSNYDNGR